MTREEAARAFKAMAASPAARWIGNKIVGRALLQKCTRCGAEQTLELPSAALAAFQTGARGDALARDVPPDFDAKLFEWKRSFQVAHESCAEVAS